MTIPSTILLIPFYLLWSSNLNHFLSTLFQDLCYLQQLRFVIYYKATYQLQKDLTMKHISWKGLMACYFVGQIDKTNQSMISIQFPRLYHTCLCGKIGQYSVGMLIPNQVIVWFEINVMLLWTGLISVPCSDVISTSSDLLWQFIFTFFLHAHLLTRVLLFYHVYQVTIAAGI